MSRKTKHIPVNTLPEGTCRGIMLMRDAFHGSPGSEEVERSHRDGGYTFIIQEKGTTQIEIDFQTCIIRAPAIIYIHPAQVHRVISFQHAYISTWIITEENLHPQYQTYLEALTPVNPLPIKKESISVMQEAITLCMTLAEKKDEKLYHSLLKDSCNTLVALVISAYLGVSKPAGHHTRFEEIARAFKTTLEKHFKTIKNPSEYAAQLNLSTAYLNECVKATTGRSVSANIHHRVILEAKRLLYHPAWSVKEIAAELGYEDYSYFTRLFSKITGMTPIAFRAKNRE